MDMEDQSVEEFSTITADELLSVVHALVHEVHPNFPVSQVITLDSIFDKDLGLDSLTRVQLIARIESKYDLALPERTFSEAETTRDLLRAVLKSESPVALPKVRQVKAIKQEQVSGSPVEAKTLIEVLDWHISQHANRAHIQLYRDSANTDKSINYSQLKESATTIAAGLQSQGLQHAQAVAIMLPTCVEYFYCFIGILMAGGIPVPIYPPARPSQLEDHMRRHAQILINCDANLLITVEDAIRVAKLLKSQVPNLKKVITPEDLLESSNRFVPLQLKESDTAFIQYTSGSTGQPKGVILSHANLLANIRAMGSVVKAGPEDVFVSWLPLYHDMGLIGAWLGSLYYAALFVVMPPLNFLAHPERWLWAIHHFRGTLSASPNFGYEYCVRRLDEKALQGLDLSSWRAAFNGAEAVSAETLEQFTRRFEPYGFRQRAMMPVYGLAESSVGLAFPPIDRGAIIDSIDRTLFMHTGSAKNIDNNHALALKFPSSGPPLPGHQVRIVDQANRELPERKEGRIQFRGPSSTSGYYRNAKKTSELFVDDWLDTGDLGYVAGGEIYVTGRIKDIIIRAGRNIYPQELEEAVGYLEGISAGRVAVFGSEDQNSKTERLIVLAETRARDESELKRLRTAINTLATDLTGSPPDDIVLAPPNTVLKTSSGKIRRVASRELYESGKIGKEKTSILWQIIRLTLTSTVPQLRRTAQYIKDWAFAVYSWSVYAVLAPVAWLTATFAWKFEHRWSVMCTCAKALAKLTRTPLSINGLDNIPQKGKPFILVSNHSSYLDTYALVAMLPGHFRFIAKMELAEKYITRKPLENIHTEFIDRYDVNKSVSKTKRLTALLESGESLMFFPEGTFTRIPGLMPFHLGAFVLAAETGVPIIPVAIRGTRSILRSDSWFPRHGAIHLEVGAPIDPQSFKDENLDDSWHQAINLRNQSRQFILRHCGEPDLG